MQAAAALRTAARSSVRQHARSRRGRSMASATAESQSQQIKQWVITNQKQVGGGIVALLALKFTFGGEQEEIVDDYLASQCGWHPTAKYNAVLLRLMSLLRTDKTAIETLLGVDRSYLEEGFQAVLGKWGTWKKYYQQGLGIQDVDAFRRTLRKALLA